MALGKTIGELQATLSQREFAAWIVFYRAHPFDDLHRYHRPAALIAQCMAGGDLQDKLDWLHPPEGQADFSESDRRTLKALGLRKGSL